MSKVINFNVNDKVMINVSVLSDKNWGGIFTNDKEVIIKAPHKIYNVKEIKPHADYPISIDFYDGVGDESIFETLGFTVDELILIK